jgi:hypothetical protein
VQGRLRFRWLPALVVLAVLAACGSDKPAKVGAAPGRAGKFACLDFQARVLSGPDNGRTWTGDLVLNADKNGVFTGMLVPQQYVDRDALVVKDPSKAVCRAVGQVNGLTISWFLYCQQDERIFGTGQLTTTADGGEELRGITSGPKDDDTGVYHGRNYPPYIRIISPSIG